MVIAILLCRSTAIATRGCTSSETSRLAQVRRVAWTGMIGTPALRARVLNAVWKLRGSSGSPCAPASTRWRSRGATSAKDDLPAFPAHFLVVSPRLVIA